MGLSPFDYLKLCTRIDQLVEDGYLMKGEDPRSVRITKKGLAVLMAVADRPLSVGRLRKPSLASERKTDTSQARLKPRDIPEGKDHEDA